MSALEDFSLVAEEKSAVTAQKIFQDFLSPEVHIEGIGRKLRPGKDLQSFLFVRNWEIQIDSMEAKFCSQENCH